MKISINWLREFCPFKTKESPREIGVRFSMATAEVEAVHLWGEDLKGVVAARLLEAWLHPDTPQLRIVRIDTGQEETRDVVCGAPNAVGGVVAPYAPPGAVVGGREVAEVTIRGIDSPGMLLSEAELGISDAADALWALPAKALPGTPLSELFPEILDQILEIDNKSLTHRPDLWGHYGIAREFSVIYGAPLKPYPVRQELASASGKAKIRVKIIPEDRPDTPPRCRRYCGLQINGVRVGRSPDWLCHRLITVGLRPINNIVDVTNYVMLELGQPLHAFDVERVRGGRILVRRAGAGELLRLLDGTETRLGPEDLVIADGEGPVAIAGVMGGEGSGISDETKSIFLESANFDPTGVRRTSMRTVRTDSSTRFEKSLDPAWARMGILRAADLILKLCPGARIVGNLQDVGSDPPSPISIETTPQEISGRLGTAISPKKIRSILEKLGFQVKEGRAKNKRAWQVKVPSWRATKDISIPEDLVEEVGRIHGYEKVKPFAPLWPVSAPAPNKIRMLERRAKQFLALHGGLVEVFTYSMVGAAHCRIFGLDPGACLRLKNPMSEDMDRLRREIVPIHLEKARENQRFAKRFGFFELGRVYLKDPASLRDKELPRENQRIAGVVCEEMKGDQNFYQLRHLILELLGHLGAQELEVRPLEPERPWIHPQIGARVVSGSNELASLYRIHPEIEARLELSGEVLAFDIDFDCVADLPPGEKKYLRLPRFPFVSFDLAVVAPERVQAAEIAGVISRGAGDSLRSLEPFDVYRGPGLPEGTKSIAFHVDLGAHDHTLSSQEAEAHRTSIIEALAAAGLRLR